MGTQTSGKNRSWSMSHSQALEKVALKWETLSTECCLPPDHIWPLVSVGRDSAQSGSSQEDSLPEGLYYS